jgi:hypothetical protein
MEAALLIWSFALSLLLVVGAVWVFDLQTRLRNLERRYESLFSAEEEPSFAAALEQMALRFSKMNTRTERLVVRLDEMDRTLMRCVQGVGFVRYSAFEDTGGDQSFSLAMVDGDGHGVIVSGLYGRDATRVYAKPIESWTSSRTLAAEEEQALSKARRVVIAEPS